MTEVMWATGRISGLISMVLFTLSLILGILARSGRPLLRIPRFSVTLLHRNVTVLALVFLVIHVVTLLFDQYAKMNVIDLVIPFMGQYLPFWQGLGTVAFDLLIAVTITSALRHRIGAKAFRAFHWLAYAMWPIAMAHSIGNGSDGTSAGSIIAAIVLTLMVIAAVAWRLSAGFLETAKSRTPQQQARNLERI